MQITNGKLTATINPHGAELTSLTDNKREYMWGGDPKFWPKHSPVLFPIVGTLRNNTYLYNGKVYALSRHGFARDNVFHLKSSIENSVTFSLTSNNETRRVYPFDFDLEMKYTLNDDSLTLDYSVTNNGGKDMPFSLGAHPAFALPQKFSNYSLKFEKDEPLVSRQLENDLISSKSHTYDAAGGGLPLSYELFRNDALIFTNLQSRAVTILEGNVPLLSVTFEKFPHLGIWTKENAPFICIEPWQGHSDQADCSGNITEKEGMLTLEPGNTFRAGFTIKILS